GQGPPGLRRHPAVAVVGGGDVDGAAAVGVGPLAELVPDGGERFPVEHVLALVVLVDVGVEEDQGPAPAFGEAPGCDALEEGCVGLSGAALGLVGQEVGGADGDVADAGVAVVGAQPCGRPGDAAGGVGVGAGDVGAVVAAGDDGGELAVHGGPVAPLVDVGGVAVGVGCFEEGVAEGCARGAGDEDGAAFGGVGEDGVGV